MTEKTTVVRQHYRAGSGRAVYMRLGLVKQLAQRSQDDLAFIQARVLALRDNPFGVGAETLSYKIASSLFILWDDGFYFLYRLHKPTSGPFSGYDSVVHILDVDGYRLDGDGNRVLDLYTDPDAVRTLAEREGQIQSAL
jgi:hypothetical protein